MKFKDWLDFIFTSSSYLLRPHYQRNHFKVKKGTLNEWVNHYVHFLGSWGVFLLVYCLMVYLFGIKYEVSIGVRLSQIVSEPPLKTLDEVYNALKDSLLVNSFFIYVFYKAVSSNAERDFMMNHFVHHKLSGLIKVIKMGGFSEESRFAEQSKDQIHNVRKNLKALVSPRENELMVFVTASGWDFFGDAAIEEGHDDEKLSEPNDPKSESLEKRPSKKVKKDSFLNKLKIKLNLDENPEKEFEMAIC